jgi:hypothetical protein
MKIDVNENKKRAELYLKEKVFVFLREFSPDRDVRFYNGFITKINTDSIMFFDIELKREFPVYLDRFVIDVSAKKDITQEIAREIMWEFYKKEGVGK